VTPFEDLHSYIALPRVTGLRLSPDGTWLAATVQQPDPDGKYSTGIWRIPADGSPRLGPSRPSGDPVVPGRGQPSVPARWLLLFASRRPDPAAGPRT
jgi:hypothetical protein